MPVSLLAVLLTFVLPAGADPYLDTGSVYAEVEGVDVTATVFSDGLAAQAIAQFAAAARGEVEGLEVSEIGERVIAGREATSVLYSKGAAVVRINEAGEPEIVPGTERTRQIYLDLGAEDLVFTIWTKDDDADLAGVTATIVDTVEALGDARASTLAFTIDGEPIGEVGPALSAGPLESAVTIGVVGE